MKKGIAKKWILFLFAMVSICFLSFAEETNQEKADFSYAFGMVIASDFSQWGLDLDPGFFVHGFKDFMDNLETRFDMNEAIQQVDMVFQAAMAERAEMNRREGESFLAQNAQRPEVNISRSGLQYEIIIQGTGKQPDINDYVKVHYTGFLLDGTIFDSSHELGEPVDLPLQGLIAGWREGLQLMREGGKSLLFIPSALAYGTEGVGNIIPPNSVIFFEVELLEVLEAPPQFYWDFDDLDYFWDE